MSNLIRMLIVEDDARAAELARDVLERAGLGCSVERVESEVEFRQALVRSPDLILSESNLPGFDGLTALTIAQNVRPSIPFIFLTGHSISAGPAPTEDRGAAGFVSKSDLEALPTVVRAAFDERAHRAAAHQGNRRKSELHADAHGAAAYLLERQAILDRTLKDEDHSAMSSILRRHPPMPVALITLECQRTRERFMKWLRNANIDIECAPTTTEALARLEARTHALLFTDRLELVQATRQLYAGSSTHVIFVDVNRDVSVREALRMGASEWMPAEPDGEEFWAHLMTARRIASLSAALQLALTDNRILSTVDELTRCGSRRFFENEFPREVERAVRLRRTLSLVMCDIDLFKSVNDSHGHEVGDEVLREFATRLTHGLRLGEDWVARVGGEEFAIVLPEVPSHEAFDIAQRLCERIGGTPCVTAAGPLTVTASFGVSALTPIRGHKRPQPRGLLQAADAALYASKRAGRNRVTLMPIREGALPS
ncbi:MAG TPA: diguanylate cyclase [Steroidobacteraceae bacterium]|nr:diguanylate cyclase [Steroidobacteraceae bacterium]